MLDLGRVGPLDELLEVRAVGELVADGGHQGVKGLGHGGLEDLGREHVVAVVLVHGGDVGVDELGQLVPAPVDDEAGLALELGRGQQDVLDKGQDAVALGDLWHALCLLDLLDDGGLVVEQVDLGVGVAGRHLAALQPGHHGVHDVRPLAVAQLGQPLLGGGEELALVDAAELHVHVQVLLVQDLQDGVEQPGERRVGRLLDDLGAGLLGVVLRHHGAQLVQVHGVLGGLLVGAPEHELQPLDVLLAARRAEHCRDDALVVERPLLDEVYRRFQVVLYHKGGQSVSQSFLARSVGGVRAGGWIGAVAYKEAMDVGEEDGQLAARPQQLCILYGGHEVATVWTSGCGAGHESIVSGWVEKWRAGPRGMEDDRCDCVEMECCRLPMATLQLLWPQVKKEVDSRSPVDLGILPIVDNLLNNLKVERLGQVLLDQGDPFLGGHRCHGGQVLPRRRDGRTRGADSMARLTWNKTQEQWASG